MHTKYIHQTKNIHNNYSMYIIFTFHPTLAMLAAGVYSCIFEGIYFPDPCKRKADANAPAVSRRDILFPVAFCDECFIPVSFFWMFYGFIASDDRVGYIRTFPSTMIFWTVMSIITPQKL